MGSQLIRLITGGVKCYVVFRIQIFHSDFIVWKMYLNAISFYLAVSAASDFTIASCALAGYRLNENYDYPYFKRNLSQFWRSWHKTVSYWFRDYVYIPLGGNKHLYRNILIVFLLAALWYEASPAGLLWALWHILGLWILKFWQSFWEKVEGRHSGFLKNIQNFSRAYPKTTQCVSVLITFHYVILGWLPFFHLPLLSF
ncbi:MAG: hypothetical protein IPJ69_05880 [Deltaproteobacteria bacterium]|nr:MAG: hypothetical protein IPJ69_05880 [Deltaproteobacteria bacterium]